MYTIHTDHLGTPQVITDNAQAVVWQADYQPFGEVSLTTEAITNNLRFPGQYFDQETGLHYNYMRDYSPDTGRYIQSDPIGINGGTNTYAYVDGNPIVRIDPTGEFWQIALRLCQKYPRLCTGALACLKNPKQCSDKGCALLKKVYKIVCNIGACRVGESCDLTQMKLAANTACYALRVGYTLCKYKGGGDYGHDEQSSQILTRIEECTRDIPINCAGCTF